MFLVMVMALAIEIEACDSAVHDLASAVDACDAHGAKIDIFDQFLAG